MKIDLHLHSPLSRKNGDSIKWDSLYDSIERLHKNNVEIAAFSDHNTFNCDFYLEAYHLAKTANILILPAIEINVVRKDGEIANIIYVFEENLSKEKLNKIQEITKKIPKRGISLNQVNDLFKEFDAIKIPHVGKSDHFKYQDLLNIKFEAIEISNETHSNYLIVSKKEIPTSIVAFSDTHKWNEYPQVRRLITEIPNLKIKSFKNLKLEFLKNQNYTKRRIDD